MERKGSYFFVIDAFVAGIIVVGMIAVLFSQFTNRSEAQAAFYTAEDLLLFLETTTIQDYDAELVRDWTEKTDMYVNGTINDTSRTLLEQIAYFNATQRIIEAKQLSALVVGDVPENVGVNLIVVNESYASKSVIDMDDADVFFSSKRIVLLRKTPTDLFDPLIVEVQTWQ